MTGSNTAGKVLGTATTAGGGSVAMAHSGLKAWAILLIVLAIIGALLILLSSTIRRLLVRK